MFVVLLNHDIAHVVAAVERHTLHATSQRTHSNPCGLINTATQQNSNVHTTDVSAHGLDGGQIRWPHHDRLSRATRLALTNSPARQLQVIISSSPGAAGSASSRCVGYPKAPKAVNSTAPPHSTATCWQRTVAPGVPTLSPPSASRTRFISLLHCRFPGRRVAIDPAAGCFQPSS